MTATIEALYASADTPLDIDTLLPPDLGKWPVSRPMAHCLARLVAGLHRRSVLEFGAGWSSLVLSQALAAAGGGRLTSVEHQPQYMAEGLWDRVARTPGVDARLVVTDLHRRLSTHGLIWSYRDVRRKIAARAPFDLMLIDGPPGQYGRSSPLHDALPLLAPGAVIVLDDAARGGERAAMNWWLATYPGLRRVVFDTQTERGIAVFVYEGTGGRRLAARAFAATFLDQWRALQRARRARTAAAAAPTRSPSTVAPG
jgi:predicted O-methyltransferase YrrM